MSVKYRGWVAAAIASAIGVPVWADGLLAPFATANRNPLVQIYGLPVAGSADFGETGQWRTALVLEAANSFTYDTKGVEQIFLDGETHRLLWQLRWSPVARWEVGMDVPYLSHEAGGLDSFIDEWHDLFGFPDGGRPQFPRDKQRFSYYRNGQPLVELDQSVDGVGDISFTAGYQLLDAPERRLALRSQLKLPTGDDSDLLGSGSTDLALGLYLSDRSLLRSHDLVLHGSVGVLWMGESDVLDEIREDWVLYGSTTLGWQYSSRVSLKLQLDMHTAFYDSSLTELGSNAAMLTLGGGIQLTDDWILDLGVTEDVAVDTAPDVVFHLDLKCKEF